MEKDDENIRKECNNEIGPFMVYIKLVWEKQRQTANSGW